MGRAGGRVRPARLDAGPADGLVAPHAAARRGAARGDRARGRAPGRARALPGARRPPGVGRPCACSGPPRCPSGPASWRPRGTRPPSGCRSRGRWGARSPGPPWSAWSGWTRTPAGRARSPGRGPAPGQARLLREFRIPGQAVTMRAGSWDAWLAARSQNARRDVRRTAKRIEKRDGAVIARRGRPRARPGDRGVRLPARAALGRPLPALAPEALAMLRDAGGSLLGVPAPAPLRHRGRGARRRHPDRVRRGRRGDGLERRLGARLGPRRGR